MFKKPCAKPSGISIIDFYFLLIELLRPKDPVEKSKSGMLTPLGCPGKRELSLLKDFKSESDSFPRLQRVIYKAPAEWPLDSKN